MRCRSWVIITPPKRDDPLYTSEHPTVFLPQSGFVQQAVTLRHPIQRRPRWSMKTATSVTRRATTDHLATSSGATCQKCRVNLDASIQINTNSSGKNRTATVTSSRHPVLTGRRRICAKPPTVRFGSGASTSELFGESIFGISYALTLVTAGLQVHVSTLVECGVPSDRPDAQRRFRP